MEWREPELNASPASGRQEQPKHCPARVCVLRGKGGARIPRCGARRLVRAAGGRWREGGRAIVFVLGRIW